LGRNPILRAAARAVVVLRGTLISVPMIDLSTRKPATGAGFDEDAYLNGNPDVAQAVANGEFASGRDHFIQFGLRENRFLLWPALRHDQAIALAKARRAKYVKYADALISEHPNWSSAIDVRITDDGYGPVVNALPGNAESEFGVVDTCAVSGWEYDTHALDLIQRHASGIVLDCGAGFRSQYLATVINLEIAPYHSTDILAVAEQIPLRDESVDAIICIAVLEHVQRPWLASAEMYRILKPQGELYIAVPFLQPFHGYPNHFFNMTSSGLKSLFDNLEIEWHEVDDNLHPIWSLTWILNSWRAGLSETTRQEFENMRVSELTGEPLTYLDAPFVTELSREKRFELAAGTALLARKKWTGSTR
jgi:SAM-dependent methyltransferase